MMRLSIGLLAGLATMTPALAHPHIWVRHRTEVISDADGKLTGIRHLWTFDEAYTAFQTLNLDSKRDGKPDPDKLAELARTNLESLVEFGYFTAAKANGAKVEFAPPVEPALTLDEGRLTLRFILPTKTVVKQPKVMSLEVKDPTFFVAFTLADGDDAVHVSGAMQKCALNVRRPPKAPEEGVQLIPDAIAGALAGKSVVGGEFVNSIIVACP
jgi:ABC-type uncharacterized transport system substrate-binding protein